MKKKYILDSSTLIEDHKSIEVLRNGIENEIFIPKTVIDELDGLKKNDSKRPQVLRVLKEIEKYKDHIQFLNVLDYQDSGDNRILQEIKAKADIIITEVNTFVDDVVEEDTKEETKKVEV